MSTASKQMNSSILETKRDTQKQTAQPVRAYLRTAEELFFISTQELNKLETMAKQGDVQAEIEYNIYRLTTARTRYDLNQTNEQTEQIAKQNAPIIKESLLILDKYTENNPRVQFYLFSKMQEILAAQSLVNFVNENFIIAKSMTVEQLSRYQALCLHYFKNIRKLAEKSAEASFYLSEIYKNTPIAGMKSLLSEELAHIPQTELESYLEKQALECLSKAAEQGFAPAQFALSNRYRWKANSKTIDLRLRQRWLLAAAEQGHAIAQDELGHSYCTDNCPPEANSDIGNTPEAIEAYRHQQAFRWFHAAAEQDMDRAKFWLADLFKTKKGVPNGFLNNEPEKLWEYIITLYKGVRKDQFERLRGGSFKSVTAALENITGTPLHFALNCSHDILTMLLEKFSIDVNKTAKTVFGEKTLVDRAVALTPPDFIKVNLIRVRLAIESCIKNVNQSEFILGIKAKLSTENARNLASEKPRDPNSLLQEICEKDANELATQLFKTYSDDIQASLKKTLLKPGAGFPAYDSKADNEAALSLLKRILKKHALNWAQKLNFLKELEPLKPVETMATSTPITPALSLQTSRASNNKEKDSQVTADVNAVTGNDTVVQSRMDSADSKKSAS